VHASLRRISVYAIIIVGNGIRSVLLPQLLNTLCKLDLYYSHDIVEAIYIIRDICNFGYLFTVIRF
jgi:hypothetical protein